MQIKIKYKEDGKIRPYSAIRIFDTPYVGEGDEEDPPDWQCGFDLDKNNECAFRLYRVDKNGNLKGFKKFFAKQNYSWDDYFEWLGRTVLSIEVDGELYFSDDDINTDDTEEEK